MNEWISPPETQKEVDRNLLIVGWLLILSSIWLLVDFHSLPVFLALIGVASRLWIVALRLPVGSRGFYKWIIPAFLLLTSIPVWIDAPSVDYRIYIATLIGFAFYADRSLHKQQKPNKAQEPTPNQPPD